MHAWSQLLRSTGIGMNTSRVRRKRGDREIEKHHKALVSTH